MSLQLQHSIMKEDIDIQHLDGVIRQLSAYITTVAAQDSPIHPHRLYTPREVAEYMRFSDVNSVYNIPETELPRHKVGPNRGSVRYSGINILRYTQGSTPVDISAITEYSIPVTTDKTRLV